MEAINIVNDLYWVGVRDPHLRVFDIIMKTEFGTTYNSYLIKGEKNILIETAKVDFYDDYARQIEQLIGTEPIHYIITNHTEPDHSGSIYNLLVKYPDAEVICTKPAYMYLKAMVNGDFKCKTVADGETLVLGGKTFKFLMTPFLHWPDTMCTYYVDEKVLFSCDIFGCHYCTEKGKIFTSQAGDFMEAYRYYFDVIMGPFKDHVLKAVGKLKTLDIKYICTSHGPIHNKDLEKYMDLYEKWSRDAVKLNERKYILIAFVSAYGYTKTIAEKLYLAMKEDKRFDVELADISKHDLMDMKKKIEYADGVLIGSPTFNQDALKPVWDALSVVCPINVRNKPAAAFGSFGWSGEAVKMIEDRLRGLKFKVEESGMRYNFAPSDEDLAKVDEFAKRFMDMIQQ